MNRPQTLPVLNSSHFYAFFLEQITFLVLNATLIFAALLMIISII